MSRTRLSLAAAAALAGATAVAAAGGLTASASTPRVHQLHLVLRYADVIPHFTGKDPAHPEPGDRFIDSGPVRSTVGKVVGSATNICTFVSGSTEATAVSQCVATYTLHRGELVATGADGNSDDTTDALVGGTGAFAAAGGTVRTVSGQSSATVLVRYAIHS